MGSGGDRLNWLKGRGIQSRAGRLSWLQLLALVIAGIAYYLNSTTTALAMLVLATVFGLVAAVIRVREAQQLGKKPPRDRGRR